MTIEEEFKRMQQYGYNRDVRLIDRKVAPNGAANQSLEIPAFEGQILRS